MANRVYTTKETLPVTIEWTCSRCGKHNVKNVVLKTKWKETSPGGRFNQQQSNKASSWADRLMQDNVQVLDGKKHSYISYIKLGLLCSCSGCKKREKWSTPNLTAINLFFIKAGVLFLIVFGITLIAVIINSLKGRGSGNIIQCLIAIFGTILLYFLAKRVEDAVYSSKEQSLQSIPQESFPALVINGESIRAAQDFPQKRATRAIQQDSFKAKYCRQCGVKLPINSKFCPACGAKIIQ